MWSEVRSVRFVLAKAAVVLLAIASTTTTTTASAAEPSECLKSSEQGLAARDAGKLREARKHFVVCAADNCQKALRIDCARWLEEVEASLPSVVFGAKDARGADLFDLTVTVDGEKVVGHESGKAFPFDPGPHVVRFEQANGNAIEEKILLRAGERNRPVIAKFGAPKAATKETPPPPSPPQPHPSHENDGLGIPTTSLVLGAIGLAAMGSFTFFAVSGSNEKDNLKVTCGSNCSDDQISTLKTQYIVADVSLGVGIVALGLATYFWIANSSKK